MSTNAPIRWFRGIREVQPSAFCDPAAGDFPPGTVVGIKTRAPVGQLDLFTDAEWQQRNRVVECDRDGRVIESKPAAIADCAPSSTVAPVLSIGDPAQVNPAEPLNATAAPLVTFNVEATPPISDRDAAIVAKLRERGIPLASIAAAVNEATPEQIVECLLDQQAKRLAAEHAVAMPVWRSDALKSTQSLQGMLAACGILSSNVGAVVQISCDNAVPADELHRAIDRFINATLTGDGTSADGIDWKSRAIRAEAKLNEMDVANIKNAEQLEESRLLAADQNLAHTKEIDDLRAAARCSPNDTLLDRVRKLAESSLPDELRKCREQLEAAERDKDGWQRRSLENERELLKLNQELGALRTCAARLAKVFDSAAIQNDGAVDVYFKGIDAIVQLIAIGVVPGSIEPMDAETEEAE